MSGSVRFPLTAIVGQEDLVEALLLCAIDHGLGGVLVRGERGTAKTTAVRALAALLPEQHVAAGCAYGVAPGEACPCDVHHDGSARRDAPMVELPLGATIERVVGALDVRRALQEGAAVFEPGLLAAAHRGVLYADEVNLLPDAAVDVLLDVAASGVNVVERDGHGIRHPARFLLVGTMNPEEGELRPQLLDRFGLGVEVHAPSDPALRTEVVRRRLRFDADPAGFVARHATGERTLAERLLAARAALRSVRLPDRQLVRITALCARLEVDGLRADLACTRAALALAALDGADEVADRHVERAAALALTHRLRRDPLAPPPSPQTVTDALADQDADGQPEPPDAGPDPATSSSQDPADASAGPDPSVKGTDPLTREPSQSAGSRVKGTDPLTRAMSSSQDSAEASAVPGPSAAAVDAQDGVAPPSVTLTRFRGQGAAGRRGRARGTGVVVGSGPGDDDLAIVATLVAARGRPVSASDLRSAQREGRQGALVVLCVDASGSMGARKRMALVKGTVLALLGDAYQRRDRVALVTFRGTGAELPLPPTGAVDHAAAALRALPTGGRTPIAAGLALAADVVRRDRLREPGRAAIVVLVSDGRANAGGDPVLAAAALPRRQIQLVVVDGEQGPVRLGGAQRIAAAAGGEVLDLDARDPQAAQRLAGRLRAITTTRSAA
ncbi:MAG TPA: VWA domain-containing protein [Baekduia sp.]|uniref:VWA domain-containing protein n=1 Tax=Baekduia sp. TaxID=2600305 RepID=UPI002B6B40C5|nr:VWA domain-containing protein [Baekduia sp.]HMJ33436.1 VWA domain-containing protein [Baekduia sp.]